MNKLSKTTATSRIRRIALESPTSRCWMPQATRWAWRRQVAAALIFGWGYLSLLPGYASAVLRLQPNRPSLPMSGLKIIPHVSDLPLSRLSSPALLTGSVSQEASLGSGKPALLPRSGDRPLLSQSAAPTPPSPVTAVGRLPLAFIENKGQVDERAKFYVRTGLQTVWLTSEGLRFDLLRAKGGAANAPTSPSTDPLITRSLPLTPQPRIRERLVFAQDFLDTARQPTIEARNPLPGIYNFFMGNDPAKWRTRVKGYAEIIYRGLWEGIDFRLYGRNGRALEQEFIVRPGGDLNRIKVAYRGIEGLTITQDGSLQIKTAFGMLKESAPRIYQEIDGKRVEVAGRFKLLDTNAYTFEVGPHHPQYALVIDPTLVYSTYLGGSSDDVPSGIAVDESGYVYLSGGTQSADFPTTPGVLATSLNGAFDIFVTKLDSTGSDLVYSTYLGGSSDDVPSGIAVDESGYVYLSGGTQSADFPTTPGAFISYKGGYSDVFVTKIDPAGSSLIYSTFLGGNYDDAGSGIAIDASGNAYVTGRTYSTSNFPTTSGAFDTSFNGLADAFVTKLNPTGSDLVYSTFLGGENNYSYDAGSGIAVDASGNAYVIGTTYSNNFPATPGAFDTSFNGDNDVFVTKLNPAGGSLVYSTYLGGTGAEYSGGIAIDASGNAYVSGSTHSANFPITLGAFDTTYNDVDVFVTKLNPTGSGLVYSTFLGGSSYDEGGSIAVDASANVYVSGNTWSGDFPTTPGAFDTSHNGGNRDAFVTKLNSSGSHLVYSTFLGGNSYDGGNIATNASGNAYVIGFTLSANFPITPEAFDVSYNGSGNRGWGDLFVTTFSLGNQAPVAEAGSDQSIYVGSTVTLDGSGSTDVDGDPLTYHWAFVSKPVGSVAALSSATAVNPTFTVDKPGSYVVSLVVNDGFVDSSNTATVTIRTINVAPVGREDAYFVDEDTALTVSAPGVLANDTDPDGDPLTAVLVSGPSNGLLSFNTDGSFTYTPRLNFSGSDTFIYKANDGSSDSDLTVVTITVRQVNDAPVASADGPYLGVTEIPVTMDASSSTDVEGASLTLRWDFGDGSTLVTTQPSITHTYAAPGIFPVTLVVNDGQLDSLPFMTQATVGNPGSGGRDDVDDFLSYANPTQARTDLPSGTTSFNVTLIYGPTIIPGTFQAELNGAPFFGFTPKPGTSETVTVALSRGRNVLSLNVDGARSDGRTATDRDRLTFIVP